MRHGNRTIDDAMAAFDLLEGLNVQITPGPNFQPAKFGTTAFGQHEAFRNRIPPEVWDGVIAEKLEFAFVDGKFIVREKAFLPVDSNGRFIFENFGIAAPFTDADWSYGFDQSLQFGYPEILERLEHAFQVRAFISAAQFQDLAEAKKAETLAGPYANLFKGKYARPFAIALPSSSGITEGDLGAFLAEAIIPAIERGYKHEKYGFPKRPFNNHRKGTLEGNVESFTDSRQDQLIAALAEGPTVWWVFLNCLQGGSINADRELIPRLPEEFMLGGTIANGTVIAAYPEIAAASGKNPLYFNAADVWRSSNSLYLCPSDADLDFDYWDGLDDRRGRCSGSVVLRCVV